MKIDTKEIRKAFTLDVYRDTPNELMYAHEQIHELCDAYDELERKLKIAVDALEIIKEYTESSENTFDSYGESLNALKQIRGEE